MPSLTLEEGKSSARYPLFSQKNRPLGQAEVPVVIIFNINDFYFHENKNGSPDILIGEQVFNRILLNWNTQSFSLILSYNKHVCLWKT